MAKTSPGGPMFVASDNFEIRIAIKDGSSPPSGYLDIKVDTLSTSNHDLFSSQTSRGGGRALAPPAAGFAL